jgi:hypothetical protein
MGRATEEEKKKQKEEERRREIPRCAPNDGKENLRRVKRLGKLGRSMLRPYEERWR